MFPRKAKLSIKRFRIAVPAGLCALALWAGLYGAAFVAPRPAARLEVPAPLLAAVRPGPLVPEGSFSVSIWRGDDAGHGAWQAVGQLGADKYNRTQLLVLRDLPAGALRVRVEKSGGGGAHLDALLLNGAPPRAVSGAPLAKLARADEDISDADVGPIEAEFNAAAGPSRQSAILTLAGRIEPEVLSREPVKFPVRNGRQEITPQSAFFDYTLGSRPGALSPDGELRGERLGEPLFYGWSPNGSGHPNSMIYGWAQDDGETLFVALDFTGDNTYDGGVDYAKVYVNLPDGVREFKLTVPDQRWGRPGFTYTDRVDWEHKVYEFAIPLRELGLDPAQAQGKLLPLAFALYGTFASPADNSEFNASLAFDSTQNCFIAVRGFWMGSNADIYAKSLKEGGQATAIDGPIGATFQSTSSLLPVTDVAYDPVSKAFLAVFLNPTPLDIYARLIGADGLPAGVQSTISNNVGDDDSPAVSANASSGGYLVVWSRFETDDTNIKGMLVSGAGIETAVDIPITVAVGNEVAPSIAYQKPQDRHLVVYNNSSAQVIERVFVAADGTVIPSVTVVSTTNSGTQTPDIAYNPVADEFLVVWSRFGYIIGQRLDASGTNILGEIPIAATGFGSRPRVAFDPIKGTYLVVWDEQVSTNYEVASRVVGADGTTPDGVVTLFTDPTDEHHVGDVAANSLSGGFLIVVVKGTQQILTPWTLQSTFIGSVSHAAQRSLPPGAGYALLGLAGLALLLGLLRRGVPRLRPAFAVVAVALAIHLTVMGGLVACTSSSDSTDKEQTEETPDEEQPADTTVAPCPLQ